MPLWGQVDGCRHIGWTQRLIEDIALVRYGGL